MDVTRDSGMNRDPYNIDPQAGYRPEETPIAAAFRSGLTPDEAQTRRVIASLPGIGDRARRVHRRRQALTSGLMAVGVAAAVFLVASLPGTPTAGTISPAGKPTSTAGESPTTEEPAAKAGKLRAIALLPTEAITAFGTGKLVEDEAQDLKGEPLIGGICVDNTFSVKDPARGWQMGWQPAKPPAGSIIPPAMIEKIVQWDDAESGSALLDELESQVAGCASGPGLEGRGVTRKLATPQELASADRVLITAASDGNGDQDVQVVMLVGNVVIEVVAVLPDASQNQKAAAKSALQSLTPTLQAALTRVTSTTEGTTR